MVWGQEEKEKENPKRAVKEKYMMKQILVGWWKITVLAIRMSHTSVVLSRHCLSGINNEKNMLPLQRRNRLDRLLI